MKNFLSKNNNKHSRNPNIDFLRINGMLAIIIHHLIYHGKIINKYPKFQKQMHLLNILCFWHVNSFGMISGLVGNNKHKFSSLFYLWILVEFYSIFFHLIYNKFYDGKYAKNIFYILYPVIHGQYWYFTSYFGMYPFLRFINSGILNIASIEFKKSIYFMIGIFILWSSFFKDKFGQNSGYSPFYLLILYTLGAYTLKYFLNKFNKFYSLLISFVSFFIFILSSIVCYNININNWFSPNNSKLKNIFRIRINSFPMIIQVVSITMFISQIKFNKYLSRIITFIGPLTFDVYLIHENPYIRSIYIKTIFNNPSNDFKLFNIYLLITKKCAYIFFICVFMAYIRNIIFKFIKIKMFCDIFETITTKIINFCF